DQRHADALRPRTPAGRRSRRRGTSAAAGDDALPGRSERLRAVRDRRGATETSRGGAQSSGRIRGARLEVTKKKPNVIASLGQPKVAVMLLLGFSSGLPFFLSSNTLGYWLRDEGTTLAAIGFLSWVGLAYSLKFLWAPIIDRVDAPIAGRLGRRRGWLIVSQISVAIGLAGLAFVGLRGGLALVGLCALFVAFSSSTQDIVVDAWRIEAAADSDELGLLSAAYQLGYRIAILVSEALILIIANHAGWRIGYATMAALMAIGVGASLFAIEPRRVEVAQRTTVPLWTIRGFSDAVVGPFREFFRTYGWLALL